MKAFAPGSAEATGLNASSWRRNSLAALLLLVLAALFFARNITGAMPAIPFDLFYQYNPWQSEAPSPRVSVHNRELSDQILQFYPWRQLALEELKNGRFPLWNPFSFCGSPLFANGQSGILFPLNLLDLLFGQLKASILLECMQLFIAAIFTWAFLRRLGACQKASIFGAVVFAFSRNMVVWLGFPAANAAILLPALFWACECLIERPGLIRALIGALLIAFQFLAGQPQTSLVCFFGVSLYLVARLCASGNSWSLRFKTLGFYAGSWLLGVLLAAVQVLPLLEYMKESAAFAFRSHFNLKAYPWYELVSFIVPDFFGTPYEGNYWGFANLVGTACYIGIGPLILALISLPKALRRIRPGAFWLLALISLGVIYRVPGIDSILRMPLFNAIDTNKFLVLIVFCLVVCSALELDCIARGEENRIFAKAAIAAAVLFLFALFVRTNLNKFVSALKLQSYEMKSFAILLLFAGLCLAIVYCHKRGVLGAAGFCWILLALSYTDLYWFGHAYNAAVPADAIPKTPAVIRNLPLDARQYRVLGTSGILPPNTSMLFGLADVRGYDAMTPGRYFKFLSRSQEGYADFLSALNLNASDEAGAPVTQSTLFVRSVRRMLGAPNGELQNLLKKAYYWNTNLDSLMQSKALGLFGIKYVLAAPGATETPGNELRLIRNNGVALFENPDPLPHCFLRRKFEVTDENSALQTAAQPGFDFKNRLLLSGIPNPEALRLSFAGVKEEGLRAQEHAVIVRQTPSSVEIAAHVAAPAIVVLGDLFYDGWEAAVDGQRVEIYQADYLFRAIPLQSAGDHKILFHYRPRSFRLGAAVTLGAAVLFCLALCFYAAAKAKRRR